MFIENESHKHRLAKELLAKWLEDAEQKQEGDYCKLAQFSWRKSYGVFVELKFHETDDPYYFECSQGLSKIGEFNPDFDRGKILFVPDITIFHKGVPSHFIEVVHTSSISEKKMSLIKEFFKHHQVEVYEIEAEEILRHTGIPQELKVKLALTT